jgi:hypothetical protein
MPPRKQPTPKSNVTGIHRYLELEISLRDIRPRIWRRFLLRDNASFQDLHQAIQKSFGWQSYHLFSFSTAANWKGETIAGSPGDNGGFGEPTPDARKVKLSRWLQNPKDKLTYIYDFGDNWEHQIVLRAIHQLPERFERRLLAGRRAGPPEDCGGYPGYEDCVARLSGESGEEAEELKEWLGDWRPETFELAEEKKSFDR